MALGMLKRSEHSQRSSFASIIPWNSQNWFVTAGVRGGSYRPYRVTEFDLAQGAQCCASTILPSVAFSWYRRVSWVAE